MALLQGTVTPAEDMMSIVAHVHQIARPGQAQQLIRDTMGAMTRIIDQLVTSGGTAAHYRKALGCLQVSDCCVCTCILQ